MRDAAQLVVDREPRLHRPEPAPRARRRPRPSRRAARRPGPGARDRVAADPRRRARHEGGARRPRAGRVAEDLGLARASTSTRGSSGAGPSPRCAGPRSRSRARSSDARRTSRRAAGGRRSATACSSTTTRTRRTAPSRRPTRCARRPDARVSTPLAWDEVPDCDAGGVHARHGARALRVDRRSVGGDRRGGRVARAAARARRPSTRRRGSATRRGRRTTRRQAGEPPRVQPSKRQDGGRRRAGGRRPAAGARQDGRPDRTAPDDGAADRDRARGDRGRGEGGARALAGAPPEVSGIPGALRRDGRRDARPLHDLDPDPRQPPATSPRTSARPRRRSRSTTTRGSRDHGGHPCQEPFLCSIDAGTSEVPRVEPMTGEPIRPCSSRREPRFAVRSHASLTIAYRPVSASTEIPWVELSTGEPGERERGGIWMGRLTRVRVAVVLSALFVVAQPLTAATGAPGDDAAAAGCVRAGAERGRPAERALGRCASTDRRRRGLRLDAQEHRGRRFRPRRAGRRPPAGELRARPGTRRRATSSRGSVRSSGSATPRSWCSPRRSTDAYGATHLTYEQVYRGVPVFGAVLKVHLDASEPADRGERRLRPGHRAGHAPGSSARRPHARARSPRSRPTPARPDGARRGVARRSSAASARLLVYRTGLIRDVAGTNQLAYEVEVTNGSTVRDFVFVHAHAGKILNRYSAMHDALLRGCSSSAGDATGLAGGRRRSPAR